MVTNTKEQQYNAAKKQLQKTGDRLGRSIDEGIFDTVLYMTLLNIKTSASCEGHLDHGVAAPWIDFEPQETEKVKKLKEKVTETWELMLESRDQGKPTSVIEKLQKEHALASDEISLILRQDLVPLFDLLTEFYSEHVCPYEHMLVFPICYQFARLSIAGEIFQNLRTQPERKRELLCYQKEMHLFTQFLRRKFEGN